MGAQCACCQCSQRTAVMIVAVVSLLHSLLGTTTIIVVGGNEPDSWTKTEAYFYSLIGAQFVMVVVSILLFLGAYFYIVWFCIPWLFLTILSLAFLIINTILHFSLIRADMLLFIVISCWVIIYMIYVVFTFAYDLLKNGKSGRNDEENKPLIRQK